MKKIYKAIDNAYSALDGCISKIVKSRLHKDKEAEERALYKLEIETNGVLQDLSYIKRELRKRDWVKVEDRLPEYNTKCLIKTNYGEYRDAVYIATANKDKGVFKDDLGWLYCGITHWMPIVPPKED